MKNLTKDEYDEWKTNPVTKAVLGFCSDVRKKIMADHNEAFACGMFYPERDQWTDSGKCQMLEDLVNLEFEDIEDTLKEETNVNTM